jgi:hypothetical protein
MLSLDDESAVARCLADAILHAAPRRGPWSITLAELAAQHAGPRVRFAAMVLINRRPLFMQSLLSALHELTGKPAWANADPAECLHNVAYVNYECGNAGGRKKVISRLEFKRWPMTAKERVEVAAVAAPSAAYMDDQRGRIGRALGGISARGRHV